MTNQWLRLWHDLPNDPKWKSIARASGKPISVVIGVYLHLLVNASANANERGRTHNVRSEDVASALDVEQEVIDAILAAMQGRVLDGDFLTGWKDRQPLREDGSAERARGWREAKRDKALRDSSSNSSERTDDQANADERAGTKPNAPDKDTDKDKDNTSYGLPQWHNNRSSALPTRKSRSTGSRLPDDWRLPDTWAAWSANECGMAQASIERTAAVFADHWHAKAGAAAAKVDWFATWRNWCRRACDVSPGTRSSSGSRSSRDSGSLWSLDHGALNALGRELGIGEARAGESTAEFIARIQAKQAAQGRMH